MHKSCDIPLWFCWHQIFHQELVLCVMTKNIDKNSILIRIFFLTIMVFLKVVLIHVILILMMLVKFATLGFLEKQVFWNKVYDIIMWVCEVVNKILLRDSNYIASKTLGPKFGNSSISVKEVIITLILYGFDQKKISEGWSQLKFSN